MAECQLHHLAIIPDGNRRWAKINGKTFSQAYGEGMQALMRAALFCVTQGVSYLSIYGLSAENFSNRSKVDLAHLFGIFLTQKKCDQFLEFLLANRIRCVFEGNIAAFSKNNQSLLRGLEERSNVESRVLFLTIHFNYGGKQEIVGAVNRLFASKCSHVTLAQLEEAMNPNGIPKPDVLFRTGGRYRLSNYMLWHIDYSELYFHHTLWPDFNRSDFDAMVQWFNNQERNFGK